MDIETVPTAAEDAGQSTVRDAKSVEPATLSAEPADPCELMRREGEEIDDPIDPALEQSLRRYYVRAVVNAGIDSRLPDQHPLMFRWGVKAPAAAVSACVHYWRSEDPRGVVPGTLRFFTHHDYLEVDFEFDDASDGEYAFTAFVDAKTLDVVAGFFYSNFRP
jgi:hypothetical protein